MAFLKERINSLLLIILNRNSFMALDAQML